MARPLLPPSELRAHNRLRGRARGLERRGPDAWRYVDATGQPAFQGTWVNVGGSEVPMRFRQTLGAGIEIQGAISGGVPGTVVFTLPVGYRPSHNLRLPASDEYGGFAVLHVHTNGDVIRGFL